jgi:hypothetical protein
LPDRKYAAASPQRVPIEEADSSPAIAHRSR